MEPGTLIPQNRRKLVQNLMLRLNSLLELTVGGEATPPDDLQTGL
jgi:hypothetical protein